MLIVVRLFEPISLLFPEGAIMPSLSVEAPSCVLCGEPASPPSRMGFMSAPDRQTIFVCCGACSDVDDDALERRIVALVGAQAIAA